MIASGMRRSVLTISLHFFVSIGVAAAWFADDLIFSDVGAGDAAEATSFSLPLREGVGVGVAGTEGEGAGAGDAETESVVARFAFGAMTSFGFGRGGASACDDACDGAGDGRSFFGVGALAIPSPSDTVPVAARLRFAPPSLIDPLERFSSRAFSIAITSCKRSCEPSSTYGGGGRSTADLGFFGLDDALMDGAGEARGESLDFLEGRLSLIVGREGAAAAGGGSGGGIDSRETGTECWTSACREALNLLSVFLIRCISAQVSQQHVQIEDLARTFSEEVVQGDGLVERIRPIRVVVLAV
jgi:hypothetical protein